MKKKLAGNVNRSPAKALKPQPIRIRKTMAGKKPPAPPQKPTFREDPGFAQAVQNYEAAAKAMQEHKFDKAKTLLEKILAAGNRELMDRARVHLNLCNQQLQAAPPVLRPMKSTLITPFLS